MKDNLSMRFFSYILWFGTLFIVATANTEVIGDGFHYLSGIMALLTGCILFKD